MNAVCGIDEAGRGPLAGPVYAACVYIPECTRTLSFWDTVTDSKKLTAKKRDHLFDLICEHSVFGIAKASVEEIDRINILQASLLAMQRAYESIRLNIDHTALIDGNKCPHLPCSAQAIIGGDGIHVEIAAASILAKVSRDRVMRSLHDQHPHYGWNSNMGYGAKAHMLGMERHGITAHHRKSFAPVRKILEKESLAA